jgi:hypothetical protein
MKITVTAALVMVQVRMVFVVVTVPAIVVTPVPAIVPYSAASMLPVMLPLVFKGMTKRAVVAIIVPIISSIIIVVVDDCSTRVECNREVLMFSLGR